MQTRPLDQVLLGAQERDGGLVGRAGGEQLTLPVGQHEADPVHLQQADASIQQDLHRPVEVGRRVQLGQRFQLPTAETVSFLHRPGRRQQAFRLEEGHLPQQPAQRPDTTLAVPHRLDRDRGAHEPAVAAPEPDREVGDPVVVGLPQPVHHRAELPAVLTGHIGRQRLADQEPLVDVEQRRRPVGLKDSGHRVR
jgi:hypothetical protein